MLGNVGEPYLPGFNVELQIYSKGSHHSPDGSKGMQKPPVMVAYDDRIRDDAGDWHNVRRTVLEKCMLDVMNILTDKLSWHTKIQNETIRSRWQEEIKAPLRIAVEESTALVEHEIEFPETAESNRTVVDETAQFIIKELLDKADSTARTGFTAVLGAHDADILKCDNIVSSDLKERLQRLCNRLADSQSEPWWQPGDEGIVRHLIHPSLYALEFGRTKVKTDGLVPLSGPYSEGDKPTFLPGQHHGYSSTLQWIPAEVAIGDGKAKITSAINNLDASSTELYNALEELLGHCITPWSHCLAISRGDSRERIHCRNEADTFRRPQSIPEISRGVLHNRYGDEYDPEDDMSNGDDEEEADENGSIDIPESQERHHRPSQWAREFWKEHCMYSVCPAPRSYESWRSTTPYVPHFDLARDYDSLQVIVKISGIDLTPAKPKYAGGNWHVEGLANEHICATAIYYYDSQNIKQDSILFRGSAEMDSIYEFQYPQSHFAGLERVFGTELTDGDAIQELPTIQTREGRLLVFPNVFQHCVSPFELDDPTKPGHRKIIVLWLVNPQKRIISTAHVPPQQAFMTREEAICNQKRIIAERSSKEVPGRDRRYNEHVAYGNIEGLYCFCEH